MSPSELPGFLDLFENRAFGGKPEWAGCYCQFYLDDPNSTNPAELTSERNRKKACDRVQTREMVGYLAYLDDLCVGWCAAGPAKNYPAFPETQPNVARVLCFVIDENQRGKGIATALLNYALHDLGDQGFEALEAAPMVDAAGQEANYHGPISLFAKAGFERGAELGNGQVLMTKKLNH